MAAAKKLIGIFVIFLHSASSQYLGTEKSNHPAGICPSAHCNSIPKLHKLEGCVVVLGNLRIVLIEKMEKTNISDFTNISFPNLREVTGFVVFYRVKGLESIGQLFPNLTRIRGAELVNNYGLVVHDIENLRDVGLYSLLKIDRGGVFIWGGQHTCYVNTVDWNAIAPRARHMLTYPEMKAHCPTTTPCRCGGKKENYCWSSKKCQRFLSGPKAEKCHPQCMGCGSDPDNCSVCRHYTYQGRCVSKCPAHTILLPVNQYCVTEKECRSLNGWEWNKTCIFECPLDYQRVEKDGLVTCERCVSCKKVCKSQSIHSLSGIQQADRCVYIAGSLTINLRSVPGAVNELKKYLGLIETVTDYLHIFSSVAVTSLDFLPSLRHIAGRKLKNDTYSVIIHDMKNLRQLFTSTVMKQIQIDRGKLKILNNPKLCMSTINELGQFFPLPSNETEIPPGLNGYSGGCEDSVGLTVQIVNKTTATVLFSPKNDSNTQYTVLYAKLPYGNLATFAPEACSKSEWNAVHSNEGRVMLTSLRPASTYAVCIETFVYSKNPVKSYLARTSIVNFTMPFEKPEPPFIQELVANSSNTVVLRWVDHRDYRQHITRYELDVALIDITPKDVSVRDHCNMQYYYYNEEEHTRHAVVLNPPIEYKSCEPDCKMLISLPEKLSLAEDYFDVCSYFESECNENEEERPKNLTYKGYIKTLALNINTPTKLFKVEKLAPFRDYRFKLRACAEDKCSRSTREVIRTLKSNKADVPSISHSLNDNGQLFIQWESPDETNGPILAYTVQVKPKGPILDGTSPYVWCVKPDVLSFIVRMQFAKDAQVRVCATTLGTFSGCSEWHHIPMLEAEYSFMFAGVIFSIILVGIPVVIGYLFYRRRGFTDSIPLVDMTSMYRSETTPAAVLFSDFMPLYSMPSNEALVEY